MAVRPPFLCRTPGKARLYEKNVCVLTFRRAAVAYRAPMDSLAVSFRFPSLLMVLLTVDKDSQYSYPF